MNSELFQRASGIDKKRKKERKNMIRVITRLLEKDIYVNHYINICRVKSKVLVYL